MLTVYAKPAQTYLMGLVLCPGIADPAVVQLSWRESSSSAAAGFPALAAGGAGPAAFRWCQVADMFAALSLKACCTVLHMPKRTERLTGCRCCACCEAVGSQGRALRCTARPTAIAWLRRCTWSISPWAACTAFWHALPGVALTCTGEVLRLPVVCQLLCTLHCLPGCLAACRIK